MATETFSGPVDYVVFAFPRGADISDGLAELLARASEGTTEVLDFEVIDRDSAGVPIRVALADVSTTTAETLAALDGIESNILDDDDLAEIADALATDQFAVAIVYEDRSLAAAAAAWSQSGGVELFSGGVDLSDLENAITEGNQS